MKLWILRPVIESYWEPWYDKTFGSVVRAETEEEARTMVSTGDEVETIYLDNAPWTKDGYNPWLDKEATSCEELVADGEPGEIIQDFYAA